MTPEERAARVEEIREMATVAHPPHSGTVVRDLLDELDRVTKERDEEAKWNKFHGLQAQRMMQERDAAIARAEKAEAYARAMVEKAADKSLDGYRELGAKTAKAEERRDAALAQVKQLREALEGIRALADKRVVGPYPTGGVKATFHQDSHIEVRRMAEAALAATEPKP